jgi:DNA-directed RNA polymerase specialized sigma24 family protein
MPVDAPSGRFRTTRWSLVLRAKDPNDPLRGPALNDLCQGYWGPLYVYLRRKGRSPEDSRDIVQGFFAYLLEKAVVEKAARDRGRFRSFLIGVLENYLANEHRKAAALKRGGGAAPLSLDFDREERLESIEPSDSSTPLDAYHRAWALAVLRRAFDSFRGESLKTHPGEHVEALVAHLQGPSEDPTRNGLATRLGRSPGDVKHLLSRSRRRLRELILDQLRDTVETEAEVEEELRDLFGFLH